MILTIKSLGMLPKKSEILNVDDKDTSYESDDSVQVVDFLQSHLPNFKHLAQLVVCQKPLSCVRILGGQIRDENGDSL